MCLECSVYCLPGLWWRSMSSTLLMVSSTCGKAWKWCLRLPENCIRAAPMFLIFVLSSLTLLVSCQYCCSVAFYFLDPQAQSHWYKKKFKKYYYELALTCINPAIMAAVWNIPDYYYYYYYNNLAGHLSQNCRATIRYWNTARQQEFSGHKRSLAKVTRLCQCLHSFIGLVILFFIFFL